MLFHRILIVQSVDDRITRRRRKYIEENSALKNFVFEHCYAIQSIEKHETLIIDLMVQKLIEEPLDSDELRQRLVEQITVFRPDLVVVFYGAILHHYAESFMTVLKSLKEKFPQLAFGIANPRTLFAEIPYADFVFDISPEILALVGKIFPPTLTLGVGTRFSSN